MADEKLLEILRRGAREWNEWRKRHPDFLKLDFEDADLSGAELSDANLSGARLNGANFSGANLSGAILREADLLGANLSNAHLTEADLSDAYLHHADLSYANLSHADLSGANFSGADLSGAALYGAIISGAVVRGTRFGKSYVEFSVFSDLDLRGAVGLEEVSHYGPSVIAISTIYMSEGEIPEVFLRGCGVPDYFITKIPALVAAMQPFQFYSCFISYSTKDKEFAERLHARMRQAELRVWFAPEDMEGGKKLHEQIDRAIQVHDRLLLVLSEDSMKSEWVMTEIRRARKTELKEGRRKLFPIRLVDYEAIRGWECFDADHGKDLAVEVREYYIPDFSNWKNHDDFEREFARLYDSLKAAA